MKCSKCGYEFGEGVTCQHCGVDRVTGLGNYSGYSPNEDPYNSGGRNKNGSVSGNNYTVKSNTMICYKCGEIIPADSKFCPHCSINLYVTCPKCGYEYSSQYPACSKCGTNREKYNEQIWKEEERQRKWREAERKRQEEEKKRREEWKKSPEGQAEQERIAREKAAKIRSEIEEKHKRGGLETFCLIMGFISVFVGTIVSFAISIVAGLTMLPFLVWLTKEIMPSDSVEKEIQKWKQEHPNNEATPYL